MPFDDIDDDLQFVQCDHCLKWFCGTCQPPESYDEDQPFCCQHCNDVAPAKNGRKKISRPSSATSSTSNRAIISRSRTNNDAEQGTILTCDFEWCTFSIQVTSKKRAVVWSSVVIFFLVEKGITLNQAMMRKANHQRTCVKNFQVISSFWWF